MTDLARRAPATLQDLTPARLRRCLFSIVRDQRSCRPQRGAAGRMVHDARIVQRVRLQDLGRAAGLSVPAVSNMLGGREPISAALAHAAERLLGLDAAAVLRADREHLLEKRLDQLAALRGGAQ